MITTGRRIAASLLLALAGLAAGADAAEAQSWAGRARLQGEVTDIEGRPIAGAKITLRWSKDPELGPEPIATDAKGKWSYLGLVGGNWTVLIDAQGFKGAQGAANANEFGPTPAIRVKMQRPSAEELRQAADEGALGMVKRGNELMVEQKWAEARAEYEKALPQLDPTAQPPVMRGIARTYYQEGKKEQALAELDKALALAPEDADTLQLIVNLLVAEGREKDAAPYIARLPAGAKLDANVLLNVGISHYNAGDYPHALEEFDRVVAENPNLPDAYYYRGLTYLATGKTAEAKVDFEKLLALDPQHKLAADAREFLKSL